jgi:hypothetical protein
LMHGFREMSNECKDPSVFLRYPDQISLASKMGSKRRSAFVV